MRYIHHLVTTAVMLALSACAATEKPASDLSGAGFVLETPNEWSRANLPKYDRSLAEQIVVNRQACQNAPLCRK